ncbi:MAG: tetratricopeptide repeat protein [Carnobacterium sp.]|uniref:tetratricopeptide repeat protein n=1 Tax=Carnobacterium sp. TaxID=48221 RepID=UPI002FC82FD7
MNRNHEAFQLWEQGNLNEAIQLLFEEIEEQPENSDSYYNLAMILIVAKKYADAQAVLETALQKKPEHPTLLYAFGNLYYQQERYTESLVYFTRVFQHPQTGLKNDAARMIGQCYFSLKEPKKALVYLLMVKIENEPDSALFLLIGNCLMQTGHFDEAKDYLEKVMEITPDNDEAWFKRGLIGMALKEPPTVFEAFFKQSSTLNPNSHQERIQQLKAIEAMVQPPTKE